MEFERVSYLLTTNNYGYRYKLISIKILYGIRIIWTYFSDKFQV